MPCIRVTCPENSLTAEQKEQLAPLLIDAVMVQEVDPVTEPARNGTFIVFNEIPQRNCFMGNEPFWLVEGITAAGFFNQKRREAAHAAIGKAFLSVLGDDGSEIELNGVHISPAYLLRIYALLIEIPEGSWGCSGSTYSALEIGRLVGTDQDPERWSELKVNTSKHSAARPS
ncbi:tautomerase family protein [Streptomyces sp. NPDC054783]